MLKLGMTCASMRPCLPPSLLPNKKIALSMPVNISLGLGDAKTRTQRGPKACRARRRRRYQDDEEYENYGHNAEIAMLESFSESRTDEVLLVRALLDGKEEGVMVLKGFSARLTGKTPRNPAISVLPARAVITSIDRIKTPLDLDNVEYVEEGLTWEDFKSRLP